MAKAREQPEDRDRIVRARKTCLRLCGRVYADGTGVYVVTGKPDCNRLLDCLTQTNNPEWTPSTLGFPPGQIQKISKTFLIEVGRALSKWRKALEDKDARKTRKKADAREIKEWKKETVGLSKRLKLLHELLEESTLKRGKAASYVTEDMARVDNMDYENITLWVGGPKALKRFTRAIEPYSPGEGGLGAAAALCAHDESVSKLPRCLLEYDPTMDLARSLAGESAEKGFDTLLAFLGQRNDPPNPNLISSIRKLLVSGETAVDVNWLLKWNRRKMERWHDGDYEDELWEPLEDFSRKDLSARPLRLLIARVESLGGNCSANDILSALDFTLKAGNTAFAAAFLGWTKALASKPDPQLAQGTWNTFIEALVLSGAGRRSGDRLRRWTAKPRKLSMPGTEELALSADVQRELARLANYQKLDGLEPGLTKSIRRLLARTHKPNQAKAAEGKLLRQIQEVCARVALDGVKDMVKEELANILGNLCKRPPTFQPSLNQSLGIVDWIQSLDKAHREKLDELLAAWDEAGPEYRALLTGNAKWLEWARDKGIQVEEWLAPKPAIRKRKGIAYHVEVATDPYRVFLMGNYFGSCLSLPDGENRDSVLANAYEANKAVVFVYDTKGNVLSRKLVGLNRGGKLGGYNTYISSDDEYERGVIWQIVDSYCEAWAKRVGIELADDGSVCALITPERLTDLFWYNDGMEPWGEAPNTAKTSEGAKEERHRAKALRKVQEKFLLWEFETGGGLLTSPAIGVDGTVYVGSEKKVYALDGQSGAKKWEFKTGEESGCSPAIGSDGTVYVGSDDNKVYALDGQNGAKKWEIENASDSCNQDASLAIGSDGTVYGSRYNYIFALDGNTGVRKWQFVTNNQDHSSPAIGSDGTLYVGSGKKLYALDGNTGAKKWEFKTGYGNYCRSSPAIGIGGTVYFGSEDNRVYALDGKSGAKKWEFETGDHVLSSPAIGVDGTVYVGSYDEKVYALDGESGAKKWEFETMGSEPSPAIGSDNTVYVEARTKLFGLDGNTGAKLWEFKTGDDVFYCSPALGTDGTLYVGASDGKVYAIKTDSKGLAKCPWPMRGQNPQHTGRANK